MSPVASFRLRPPVAIFDLTDRYLADLGIRGVHPRPVGPVELTLVERLAEDGTREPLQPALVLRVVHNPSGYDVWLGQAAPAGGQGEGRRFDRGRFMVRIGGRFYQSAEVEVELPQTSPVAVALEPGFAYPFPRDGAGRASTTLLRGGVRRTDGSGIAGARVEVPGTSRPYETGASGEWVLVLPGGLAGPVTVRISLPDGTVREIEDVPLVPGRESSLGQTALRGWVLGEGGRPLEGARIAVDDHPGESRSGPDGGWFFYFDPDRPDGVVSVTATLPDGRSTTVSDIPLKRRSTVLVPTLRFSSNAKVRKEERNA